VTLVVAAALLLAPLVAAHHHAHHAAGDSPCVICWYVGTRVCLPEATPPPPVPTIAQRMVLLAPVQPKSRPLIPAVARGPPLQLL
jgi:hypothetical protein